LQVLVIISSVYLDVLFAPIPTFPAIAGYCTGLLCAAGIRPYSVLGIFILLVVLVATAIMSCIFYRHQTIIPASNSLRVSKKARLAIQILLPVIMGVIPVTYASYPFQVDGIVKMLKESPYKLAWILNRGPYFIHERGTVVLVLIFNVELYLIIFNSVLLFLFWHMFYVLRVSTTRSPASLRQVRRSLILLFVQITVPLAMIFLPAFLLFTSLICECIPFQMTLPAYCVLTLHPLLHNIILLSITPTYRRFIVATIRRIP
ncbi:hypothetical protein PENTCL1PPCAC_21154, partial [Pristionchus entomophagus]